jgi:hypothetical protein
MAAKEDAAVSRAKFLTCCISSRRDEYLSLRLCCSPLSHFTLKPQNLGKVYEMYVLNLPYNFVV